MEITIKKKERVYKLIVAWALPSKWQWGELAPNSSQSYVALIYMTNPHYLFLRDTTMVLKISTIKELVLLLVPDFYRF